MISKIGFVTLIGLFGISVVQASQMYRFKVDGRTQMYGHVPPEYVHLGYEVLNSSGMVVRVVPPAPTAEELVQRRAEEAAQKARAEATAKQRQTDQDLMRLYARPADVDRAKKRKIDEVEAQIQMQNLQLDDLKKKLADAQTAAANFERRNQDVPADLRMEIAQLQNGIRDNESGIRQRNFELEQIAVDYGHQRERLRVLQVYPLGTLPEDIDIEMVNQRVPN